MGDIVAETPFGTQVPVTPFPTIGIKRPGTDRWPVLMQELGEISEWVRTQAVPRLITGTEPPKPDLPTRYDITIGHINEHEAMSAGSSTSAAERHKRRLEAAAARTGMVETLSRLNGSPSAEQVAAWLISLTDEELLQRTSQLKQTHTYDPDIVLRNLTVFEGMRNDAVAFRSDARAGD